jgi:DegV family protein with EDD domain
MIKIIADTTSVIDPQEAETLGIGMIPQIIIIGEKSYRDDNEITTEEFLSKLKNSPILPKTAAPPPALYSPIFEQVSFKKDTAIVICPSADVSGTVRSASIAAQDYPDADIRIFDSRTIGPVLGTMVYKAQEWANAGVSADEIIARLEKAKKSCKIYFYVDTLEYLHKGGRIGGASALIGSILQVKPILIFIDGQVKPFETQRTKKRALARIIELVNQECPNRQNAHLSIFQADALTDAEFLKTELSTKIDPSHISFAKLPPAIIVHAGPGVVAVGFFTNFPE